VGGEKKPAEQPAPEERLSRPGTPDNAEERDESEESQKTKREGCERKCAEADGRDGQNQDSTDVSGTSLRVDWDR
jgi:hypothetical protein